eukprot:c21737_g1_i1 orf=432-2726(-)
MESVKHSVRFTAVTGADSPLSNSVDLDDLDSNMISAVGYVEPKYQSHTEKGIRLLCSELLKLKKASAEEMRKNVFANYTAFIRTSQELGELELELTTMQALINTHAALVRDLLEGVHLQSTPNVIGVTGSGNLLKEEKGGKKMELEDRFHALSDAFDVYLAEHRVDDAVSALHEAEIMVSEAHSDEIEPSTTSYFSSVLFEKKSRLVAHLVKTAWELPVHGYELHQLVSHLNKLGEVSHAHTLLLKSYRSRIQNGVNSLRPTCSWYAGAYVTNLAQLYFSTILQASYDSIRIFGNAPAFASELVLWACKETEDYVFLVRKHISSFSVAACGISAVVDSIQISLGYCTLLEKQGLLLCPLILKSLKPCVEGCLDKCVRRMEEAIIVYCASDNWVLTEEALLSVSRGRGKVNLTSSVKLSISAYKLLLMVQGLLEDTTFMISIQFGRSLLEGVLNVFGLYIKLLIKALPHGNEVEDTVQMDDGMKLVPAESEAQQLVILGNAAALADELLPLSVMKWGETVSIEHGQERQFSLGTQSLEQKDWRRRSQRAVDELRDTICEQHVLEFLFEGSEKPLLTADMYMDMNLGDEDNASIWVQNPMPSAPFQALLKKFYGLEQRARDVLAGRERVIVMLFMRLTEAFVMWLSKDEYFWGSIEDALKPLSPLGLQQFVFDMQFVVQIASAGRYASKKLHQTISAMISRAESAFLAFDVDSKSVLQDDKWYEDKAKCAMRTLLSEIANSVPDKQELDDSVSESGPYEEDQSLEL